MTDLEKLQLKNVTNTNYKKIHSREQTGLSLTKERDQMAPDQVYFKPHIQAQQNCCM